MEKKETSEHILMLCNQKMNSVFGNLKLLNIKFRTEEMALDFFLREFFSFHFRCNKILLLMVAFSVNRLLSLCQDRNFRREQMVECTYDVAEKFKLQVLTLDTDRLELRPLI